MITPLVAAICLSWQSSVTDVPKGSPLRKTLLTSLRKPVEKSLKQKVVFEIKKFRQLDGWAMMVGVPRTSSGKAIDYTKTSYAEQVESGAFDDWICALWKKKGSKWTLVTHVIGATDVTYADWNNQFGCPVALLEIPTDPR